MGWAPQILSGLRPSRSTCIATYFSVSAIIIFAIIANQITGNDWQGNGRLAIVLGLLSAAGFSLAVKRKSAWWLALIATVAVPIAGHPAVPLDPSPVWTKVPYQAGIGFVAVLSGALASLLFDPNVYQYHFTNRIGPCLTSRVVPLTAVIGGVVLVSIYAPNGVVLGVVLIATFIFVQPLRYCLGALLFRDVPPVSEKLNQSQQEHSWDSRSYYPPLIMFFLRTTRTEQEKQPVQFDTKKLSHWLAIVMPIAVVLLLIGGWAWLVDAF